MKRRGWLPFGIGAVILGGCGAPSAAPVPRHETSTITLDHLADVAVSFPSYVAMIEKPSWTKAPEEKRLERIAEWCETYYASVYLNLEVDPRERLLELIQRKTNFLLDEKQFESPAKQTAAVPRANRS